MKIMYPALFHEKDGSFRVEFPNLEGCKENTYDSVMAQCRC